MKIYINGGTFAVDDSMSTPELWVSPDGHMIEPPDHRYSIRLELMQALGCLDQKPIMWDKIRGHVETAAALIRRD